MQNNKSMGDKENEEKQNKKSTKDFEKTLNELDELTKLDEPNVANLRGKIEKFKDGIELLHGDYVSEKEESNTDYDENEKEPLNTKELKQLYRYVNNVKYVTDQEVEKLDQDEIDRMIKISRIMLEHMSYMPKKHFGISYKKERKRKNRGTKASRKNNR